MQHEHEFEASPGLPEKLPAGERVLWQGAPDWWQLAVHALHVRKLAVYFTAMIGVQAAVARTEGQALAASLALSTALALLALGLLTAIAWMSARTTMYTLTSRRIVMRIGIVLTVSYNLPLKQIAGASLKPLSSGFGEVALALKGSDRIAWVHLWPHARPWHLRRPQPVLRCLAQAQSVGERIQNAWLAQNPGTQAELGQAPVPRPASHRLQAAQSAAG
jgi:hypothetical protein